MRLGVATGSESRPVGVIWPATVVGQGGVSRWRAEWVAGDEIGRVGSQTLPEYYSQ
jgi:hypothetical protein